MQLFSKTSGTAAKRSLSDVLGIDLGTSGVKAVRLKQVKDHRSVVAADLLPTITLGTGTASLDLPKNLVTNYAALAVTGESSLVRLLSLPGNVGSGPAAEKHIREHVGVDASFRLSFSPVPPPAPVKGKAETRFLAAALPEQEAENVLSLVESGPPAPRALEVAGLAAMTAFMHGPGARHPDDAVGMIEAGAKVTLLALFVKRALVLVRKFDFGSESLVAKVQQQMGVDEDIARGIMADGSFDISGPAREVMGPFLRQLSISRDFVERKENCRMGAIYLSGGLALSKYWRDEIRRVTGLAAAAWDPFEGFSLLPGAVSDALQAENVRFAGAMGAALGALEAS